MDEKDVKRKHTNSLIPRERGRNLHVLDFVGLKYGDFIQMGPAIRNLVSKLSPFDGPISGNFGA